VLVDVLFVYAELVLNSKSDEKKKKGLLGWLTKLLTKTTQTDHDHQH